MSAMIYGKAETANRKVAAPCDSEIKVTVLVGRAIDAPVENNPVCLIRCWMMKQQEMLTTALELNSGNGI